MSTIHQSVWVLGTYLCGTYFLVEHKNNRQFNYSVIRDVKGGVWNCINWTGK